MRSILIAVCSAALLGGLSTTASATEPVAAEKTDSAELTAFKKAIRLKYDMKEKAFATHDAETIVTRFYAEDAISVGQGFGIFIGREQLRPLFAKAVNQYTVKVISVHTKVQGNAGWDWADFVVYPVDAKEKQFTLAILFLWVKREGKWMCQGDFYVDGSFVTGKLVTSPP
jgi:hypothetical protein